MRRRGVERDAVIGTGQEVAERSCRESYVGSDQLIALFGAFAGPARCRNVSANRLEIGCRGEVQGFCPRLGQVLFAVTFDLDDIREGEEKDDAQDGNNDEQFDQAEGALRSIADLEITFFHRLIHCTAGYCPEPQEENCR